MLIDITLPITPQLMENDTTRENKSLAGHLGTHFDVMNKEFPMDYTRRKGVVFDVSAVKDRDIGTDDICLEKVERDMFVAFYSGYIQENEYGSKAYFANSPQLSHALIDALLDKGVSVIALDFACIRRGSEHVPKDQFCADRDTFVIENLYGLKALVEQGGHFIAHTYPMRCQGLTGLPCRVIAETE